MTSDAVVKEQYLGFADIVDLSALLNGTRNSDKVGGAGSLVMPSCTSNGEAEDNFSGWGWPVAAAGRACLSKCGARFIGVCRNF